MRLDAETEEKLKSEAVAYLKDGKPDWDIPHTLLTVHWMRELIDAEGGDERILVSTMYLHDIGYPKLKKGYTFDDLMKSKQSHDEIGAKPAKPILEKLGYPEAEVKEITTLIGHHYKKDRLDSHNAQLVLEADGLAKIDWEHIPPNFDKENSLKYLEYFKGRNLPKFKTETGKRFLKDLLAKSESYWG